MFLRKGVELQPHPLQPVKPRAEQCFLSEAIVTVSGSVSSRFHPYSWAGPSAPRSLRFLTCGMGTAIRPNLQDGGICAWHKALVVARCCFSGHE